MLSVFPIYFSPLFLCDKSQTAGEAGGQSPLGRGHAGPEFSWPKLPICLEEGSGYHWLTDTPCVSDPILIPKKVLNAQQLERLPLLTSSPHKYQAHMI